MPKMYVDVDTLKYMLYDVHKLENLLSRERFQDHDKESLDMFLNSVKEFADRELFPYFKEMDENPAYHRDGKVFVLPVERAVRIRTEEAGSEAL